MFSAPSASDAFTAFGQHGTATRSFFDTTHNNTLQSSNIAATTYTSAFETQPTASNNQPSAFTSAFSKQPQPPLTSAFNLSPLPSFQWQSSPSPVYDYDSQLQTTDEGGEEGGGELEHEEAEIARLEAERQKRAQRFNSSQPRSRVASSSLNSSSSSIGKRAAAQAAGMFISDADDEGMDNDELLAVNESNRIRGLCTDMCPRAEIIDRIDSHQISVFELAVGVNPLSLSSTSSVPYAVKKYRRAAAAQTLDPRDVRTPSVLFDVCRHLIDNVVDRNDQEWHEVCRFATDRFRAVRSEFMCQGLSDRRVIQCFEWMVRYHILAFDQLKYEAPENFDPIQNMEKLTQTLTSLRLFYRDNAASTEPFETENEAEMQAYLLFSNFNKNFFQSFLALDSSMQSSTPVQFALSCYNSMREDNYARFFSLFRSATYLQTCLLLRFLPQIRQRAVEIISHSYHHFPLTDLQTLLCLDSIQHTVALSSWHGLEADTNKQEIVFALSRNERQTFVQNDNGLYIEDKAEKILSSKRPATKREAILNPETQTQLTHKATTISVEVKTRGKNIERKVAATDTSKPGLSAFAPPFHPVLRTPSLPQPTVVPASGDISPVSVPGSPGAPVEFVHPDLSAVPDVRSAPSVRLKRDTQKAITTTQNDQKPPRIHTEQHIPIKSPPISSISSITSGQLKPYATHVNTSVFPEPSFAKPLSSTPKSGAVVTPPFVRQPSETAIHNSANPPFSAHTPAAAVSAGFTAFTPSADPTTAAPSLFRTISLQQREERDRKAAEQERLKQEKAREAALEKQLLSTAVFHYRCVCFYRLRLCVNSRRKERVQQEARERQASAYAAYSLLLSFFLRWHRSFIDREQQRVNEQEWRDMMSKAQQAGLASVQQQAMRIYGITQPVRLSPSNSRIGLQSKDHQEEQRETEGQNNHHNTPDAQTSESVVDEKRSSPDGQFSSSVQAAAAPTSSSSSSVPLSPFPRSDSLKRSRQEVAGFENARRMRLSASNSLQKELPATKQPSSGLLHELAAEKDRQQKLDALLKRLEAALS